MTRIAGSLETVLDPKNRRSALDQKKKIADLSADVAAIEALVRSGTGTPESNVTAPVGTIFLRTDGGTNTTLYVKETGTGNTGWVAK